MWSFYCCYLSGPLAREYVGNTAANGALYLPTCSTPSSVEIYWVDIKMHFPGKKTTLDSYVPRIDHEGQLTLHKILLHFSFILLLLQATLYSHATPMHTQLRLTSFYFILPRLQSFYSHWCKHLLFFHFRWMRTSCASSLIKLLYHLLQGDLSDCLRAHPPPGWVLWFSGFPPQPRQTQRHPAVLTKPD